MSETISATCPSMSAAVSRFIARRAAKRASKSAAPASKRSAMEALGLGRSDGGFLGRQGVLERMAGACLGGPGQAQIRHGGLDALHFEPDHAASGADQRDPAAGRRGLLEMDGQEFEN